MCVKHYVCAASDLMKVIRLYCISLAMFRYIAEL